MTFPDASPATRLAPAAIASALLAWAWLAIATAHATAMTVATRRGSHDHDRASRSSRGSSPCDAGASEGAVALPPDLMFADSFEIDSP